MERENFRIVKSKEELYSVKYITAKGLKIKFSGLDWEMHKTSINTTSVDAEGVFRSVNDEFYTITTIDGQIGAYKSIHEAVNAVIDFLDAAAALEKNKAEMEARQAEFDSQLKVIKDSLKEHDTSNLLPWENKTVDDEESLADKKADKKIKMLRSVLTVLRVLMVLINIAALITLIVVITK